MQAMATDLESHIESKAPAFDKDWKEVLQTQAKPRWNPETMWTGA